MAEKNIQISNKKKYRIKISNIRDFRNALRLEKYNLDDFLGDSFKEEIGKVFALDAGVRDRIFRYLNENDLVFRADDIRDFIDYIEKIILFEDEHKKLCEKLSDVKTLIIDRVEYERETSPVDDVLHIIDEVNRIREAISFRMTSEENLRLDDLEREIGHEYLYAKDIELLKKMIIRGGNVEDRYDDSRKTKTLFLSYSGELDDSYIKAKFGSVEYHDHLRANIPRLERLIRNLDKYLEDLRDGSFYINQSEVLQDSINVAMATFDNKVFKAISGSDEIEDYIESQAPEEASFESCRVNKLGEIGVGYNRAYDSEKKILEEINRQIERGELRDYGDLILYSKWEPCPSCYYVISQFLSKYPNINVRVKYNKKYGE